MGLKPRTYKETFFFLSFHKDYFEMKIIEKKQVQEELSTLPSLPSSMA